MAPTVKKARKQKLERACAIYFTNEQMEVLRDFVQQAIASEGENMEENAFLCICAGFTILFESWDAFHDDTEETYSYRYYFREKSVMEIRSIKSYLRHKINCAYRVDPESKVAEPLKIALATIMEMLLHVNNLPFDSRPEPADYECVQDMECRPFHNSQPRFGRIP